ncbi:MAG: 30S ribosomal protein S4 [Firmicutes bacterium]|nr:30S ribosomal protein S4 [Bacillota bacterium]MCL5038970.1 30S ribosomal protein S4 [Bacillota bacterium]
MARYTGPVCRLCRREGIKLFLKGERCYTKKCPVDRRSYAPGQHGQTKKKISEYGLQLREKQRARRFYGILEAQFRRYFAEAERARGITGEALLGLLERRLDNVVFRMGLGASRAQARQLVRHGHFAVNGRRVSIPSFSVKEGDVITVTEKSRGLDQIKVMAEAARGRVVPGWLEMDLENLRARVTHLPRREEIDVPLQEHLIIELYSR